MAKARAAGVSSNRRRDHSKGIRLMKSLLIIATLFVAAQASAADCVTNRRGQTVCANGSQAVAVNPQTGTVTTAQKRANGATTVQNSNGSKAAYNPNTGNSAVSTTNANGVATTRTAHGGQAKTKNGMGVAQGPNGKTCVKGANNAGCTK
jgi:hypothetical protein